MAIRVEHELHARRRGRNLGVGLVLAALVAITFGLTIVKVTNLDDIRKLEAFDRPAATAPAASGEREP